MIASESDEDQENKDEFIQTENSRISDIGKTDAHLLCEYFNCVFNFFFFLLN